MACGFSSAAAGLGQKARSTWPMPWYAAGSRAPRFCDGPRRLWREQTRALTLNRAANAQVDRKFSHACGSCVIAVTSTRSRRSCAVKLIQSGGRPRFGSSSAVAVVGSRRLFYRQTKSLRLTTAGRRHSRRSCAGVGPGSRNSRVSARPRGLGGNRSVTWLLTVTTSAESFQITDEYVLRVTGNINRASLVAYLYRQREDQSFEPLAILADDEPAIWRLHGRRQPSLCLRAEVPASRLVQPAREFRRCLLWCERFRVEQRAGVDSPARQLICHRE